MIEISLIRNGKTTWEYNSLNKKHSKKLYSIAALSIATLNLDSLAQSKIQLNFGVFNSVFGIIPNWIYIVCLALVIGGLLVSTMSKQDWSKDSILENILYLVLALLPGAALILIGMGVI